MRTSSELSIIDVLTKSSQFLVRHGVPNSKLDAEWLVSHVLKCKRIELYLRYEELLSEEILNQIRALVLQRAKRVPLQHILGTVQFAGLSLNCDSRALVPRNETEFFVDLLLQHLSSEFDGTIVDLGTGSGAIILGLCALMPKAKGFGLDNSEAALSLVRENVIKSSMSQRVKVLRFNWYKDDLAIKPINLIVSNPPYLSQYDWLDADPEVKEYDPKCALVASNGGMADIEKIVEMAGEILEPTNYLALEFGDSQSKEIAQLLKDNFECKFFNDQYSVKRFVLACKK